MKNQRIIGLILLSCSFLFSITTISAQKIDRERSVRTAINVDAQPSLFVFEAKNGFKLFVNDTKRAVIKIYNSNGKVQFSEVVRENAIVYINTKDWRSGSYVLDVVLNGEYFHEKMIYVE